MRLLPHSLIYLCLVSYSAFVSGFEAQAHNDSQFLHIYLNNIQYPDTLWEKELTSGLPNTVDFISRIYRDDSELATRVKRFNITFDLWDEEFTVTELAPNGNLADQWQVKNLDDVLIDLKWKRVISVSSFNLPPTTVQLQIALNPIQEERIQKIKEWTATSKGYTVDNGLTEAQSRNFSASGSIPQPTNSTAPSGNSVGNVNATSGAGQANTTSIGSGPRFKKLFDKILDQTIQSNGLVAQWQSDTELITIETIVNKETIVNDEQ